MDFSTLTLACQKNAWPAMVADLAEQLGVSAASLAALGIGWLPGEACWTFPERDAEGKIIGLVRRFKNGKKISVEGGKRGLTYALDPDFAGGTTYVPGSHNWVRCSDAYPCPICGRASWCLVSAEDPADPKAVICGRTAEGATIPLGEAGYLHVRKSDGQVFSASALPMSALPILVMEGQ